jgi:hypothetical protein
MEVETKLTAGDKCFTVRPNVQQNPSAPYAATEETVISVHIRAQPRRDTTISYIMAPVGEPGVAVATGEPVVNQLGAVYEAYVFPTREDAQQRADELNEQVKQQAEARRVLEEQQKAEAARKAEAAKAAALKSAQAAKREAVVVDWVIQNDDGTEEKVQKRVGKVGGNLNAKPLVKTKGPKKPKEKLTDKPYGHAFSKAAKNAAQLPKLKNHAARKH